jgi:hypothetical protein
MINLHTKFHMRNSSGSVFTAVNLKARALGDGARLNVI